jgi:hypothetical protein
MCYYSAGLRLPHVDFGLVVIRHAFSGKFLTLFTCLMNAPVAGGQLPEGAAVPDLGSGQQLALLRALLPRQVSLCTVIFVYMSVAAL